MAQETLAWLAREAPAELTLSQRLGAAMLHQGEELTNETYRTATGVDSVQATRELAGLVDAELAEPEGERRGRKYRLHPKHRPYAPAAIGPLPHEAVDEGVAEGVGGDQSDGAITDRTARMQWIMSEIDRLGGIKVRTSSRASGFRARPLSETSPSSARRTRSSIAAARGTDATSGPKDPGADDANSRARVHSAAERVYTAPGPARETHGVELRQTLPLEAFARAQGFPLPRRPRPHRELP